MRWSDGFWLHCDILHGDAPIHPKCSGWVWVDKHTHTHTLTHIHTYTHTHTHTHTHTEGRGDCQEVSNIVREAASLPGMQERCYGGEDIGKGAGTLLGGGDVVMVVIQSCHHCDVIIMLQSPSRVVSNVRHCQTSDGPTLANQKSSNL